MVVENWLKKKKKKVQNNTISWDLRTQKHSTNYATTWMVEGFLTLQRQHPSPPQEIQAVASFAYWNVPRQKLLNSLKLSTIPACISSRKEEGIHGKQSPPKWAHKLKLPLHRGPLPLGLVPRSIAQHWRQWQAWREGQATNLGWPVRVGWQGETWGSPKQHEIATFHQSWTWTSLTEGDETFWGSDAGLLSQ